MLSPSDAPWFADLDVRAGILQSCAVFSATGECWLVGEEALRFLDQIGWLSYDLLPASPSASLPPASDVGRSEETRPSPGSGAPTLRAEALQDAIRQGPPLAPWRPARTVWGDQVWRNPQALTRDQRRVLALIDGRRTVEELARLLGTSAQALSDMLTALREQQVID